MAESMQKQVESKRCLDGYLEWKGPKMKELRKVWTVLQGRSLYLYPQKVGTVKEPKILGSAKLTEKTQIRMSKKDCCKFTVHTSSGDHKFKASSQDETEKWRVYILSLAWGRIPDDCQLLPGFMIDIQTALKAEQELKAPTGVKKTPLISGSLRTRGPDSSVKSSNGRGSTSSTLSRNSSHDSWRSSRSSCGSMEYRFYDDHLKNCKEATWLFHNITREDAENILWNNTDKGDLLIRESESFNGDYVISARLQNNDQIYCIQHYHIMKKGELFKLDIDEEHPPVLNLYEMLNYFIDKTDGQLRPLMTNDLTELKLPSNIYSRELVKIIRADQDPDSGEWGPKPVSQEVIDQEDYLVPADIMPLTPDINRAPDPPKNIPETQGATTDDVFSPPRAAAQQPRRRRVSEPATRAPNLSELYNNYQNQPALPPRNVPLPPPPPRSRCRRCSEPLITLNPDHPLLRTNRSGSSQELSDYNAHHEESNVTPILIPPPLPPMPQLPPLPPPPPPPPPPPSPPLNTLPLPEVSEGSTSMPSPPKPAVQPRQPRNPMACVQEELISKLNTISQ